MNPVKKTMNLYVCEGASVVTTKGIFIGDHMFDLAREFNIEISVRRARVADSSAEFFLDVLGTSSNVSNWLSLLKEQGLKSKEIRL